ncbi:MAG: SRPBCC family protein [Chitinophagales bacterium]
MTTILLNTEISAPIKRCFDMARSIDLHQRSSANTNERAIDGVRSGLIGLNQTVTWRAKHFGITQTLTVKITEFSSPFYFKDVMLRGAFRKMEHLHFFEENNNGTIMRDQFDFEAPFGFLGRLIETFFLTAYLKKFLLARNEFIKSMAESDK